MRKSPKKRLAFFYNAFYSNKLATVTKWIAYATVILAGATILQTINAIYGPELANKYVEIIRFIIIIAIVSIFLKSLWDLVKSFLVGLKEFGLK